MNSGNLTRFLQGRRTPFACVLLAATTLAVYWPVLSNSFTNYDDTYYVTENAQVQSGVSWEGLAWAFGSLHGEHTYWHPLTWASHMIDYELFGLKAWGHHLVNLLFHAVNSVLVFLVFRRMTGAFWRCAVLAVLFALHPLQVDTVAWVAERKNLISALFWLLTMWAYAKYAAGGGRRVAETGQRTSNIQHPTSNVEHVPPSTHFYLLSLLFFALGLMCKPVLVTLPFALLLLDYWPLRRLALNPLLPLLREKLPFFALAGISCLVTIMAHRGLGMLDVTSGPPPGLRMENAIVSYVRYLGSTFWPMNLAVFYPYPTAWPLGKVLLSGLLLLGVSALVGGAARQRPYLLVGWFWFLGVLVPFIGLVQAGWQAMADRFAYLPLVGLFLALVWGAHGLAGRWRHGLAAAAVLALAAAVCCAALTRRQIGYWKDDESLFRRALAVTADNGLARLNLGAALNAKGQFEEAVGHLQEAVRLNPATETAHINLAYALARQQRLAEAVSEYEAALRLRPDDAGVHNDLGLTLARQGRADEAINHYREALRLKSGFAEAHYNLGLTLAERGWYAEAAAHLQEAVRLRPQQVSTRQKLAEVLAVQQRLEVASEPYREALQTNPNDAGAHADLGRVMLDARQPAEAIEHCAEAARLAPKDAEIQYQFGVALAQGGQAEKAARQFELALELDPQLATAHYALGVICQQQQRVPDALKHWREAARLSPQWPDPLNNQAWVLATDPSDSIRNGAEAVMLAQRAVELVGTNNVGVLDTLAAAYAEAGRFAEAITIARQAQAMARGQAELAEQIRQRLALYNSNQPYRENRQAR
jgi:protein O-mannosyl-transferase